ncbi:MAG: alpha/beta hydrolase [Clostridia bacterium]|nr:alpha/beta hydrolase [Clostridia bacterium]
MTKFTILSHNGEDTVQCYLEVPENPCAIVQICHGMCEYYGRYENFRNALLRAGFAVCGHDHAGHGASARDKRRYGYFGKKDGYRVLVEDTHAVSIYVKEKLSGLPLFLMGHSMGSFVARDYISAYGEELAGVILMGTAGPNPALGAGLALAKSIRALKGEMHRSALIHKLAFGRYTSRIAEVDTGYEWISRDAEVIAKYAGDEQCTFIFTVAGFIDLFTLLGRVNYKKWADSVPKELPVLLISGKEDPVGDYGKGVDIVYDRLARAGVENTEEILYDDMRHEVLNEYGREQVEQDLILWLEKRL